MKAKRVQLAMAKKIDANTTIFERVQHANMRVVLDLAHNLAAKGYKPVAKPQKVVVEI